MRQHSAARIAQAVSRALAEAMAEGGWSANALAKKADVNRQVITNVLNGKTWPDLFTIASLEHALGVILWPDHLSWPATGQPAHGGRRIGAQRPTGAAAARPAEDTGAQPAGVGDDED